MKLTVCSLNIHYIDTQTPGPVVLLLHGWAAPVETYRRIIDLLARKYRVVAFDMPGVGGSDEPANPMTVDDYAALTLAFCEKLGLPSELILVCHSHGGRVALRLMGDAQSPLGVQKAVFIDTSGVVPKRSVSFKVKLRTYKAVKALALSKPFAPVFRGLYERMRDKRSSADYKAASEVMRKTMSIVLNTDMTPFMPRVTAPVLLIWGEHDTATPLSDGVLMEKLIPNAGLAIIKNAGHYPFLDNPVQFDAVLNAFL